ncbi:MAG TPA: hypothetical protein VGG49_11695 [Steroidobacteraceae bacterium]|jgi:hypothetical protein
MTTTPAANQTDDVLGVAWFHSLSEYQRCLWLLRAGSDVPADAWALYKSRLPQHQISPTPPRP